MNNPTGWRKKDTMMGSNSASNSHFCGVHKTVLLIACAIVVVIMALTVWPTLYRYDHFTENGHTYPVRIHRFTGEAQMWYPEAGWRK